MKNFTCTYLTLSVVLFAAVSCGVDMEEDSRAAQERIIQSYIKVNYPDAVPSPSGLYIVADSTGDGRSPVETSYVLVDYYTQNMDNTISSYCSEEIARQLGEYSNGTYYGPKIWEVDNLVSGVNEVVLGMKEGGFTKTVIPSWLLSYNTGSSFVGLNETTQIYNIKLEQVIDNITDYEIEQLQTYADYLIEKYEDIPYSEFVDTLLYGFHFAKLVYDNSDTLQNGDLIQYWYVGRFLDGKVFDTNIADTAKKYGIYDESNSNAYYAQSFTHYDEDDDAVENNELVRGVAYALRRMEKGEKAITYFYSPLGYDISGNNQIPGYCPLSFELWVQKDSDDDDIIEL